MHAVILWPPDGVVGSGNCRWYLFAACTVEVTVYPSRQAVSAHTSGLSRYSAQQHPAKCILPPMMMIVFTITLGEIM